MIDQSIYRKTCVCSRDPNYEEDPEVLKDLGREGLAGVCTVVVLREK